MTESFPSFYFIGMAFIIISIATGIYFNLFNWNTFGSGQEIEMVVVMVSGIILVGIGRIVQLLEDSAAANHKGRS